MSRKYINSYTINVSLLLICIEFLKMWLFICKYTLKLLVFEVPAGAQRLYNVSFRVYLRYFIYERLPNVVTTFVNERCFTYV